MAEEEYAAEPSDMDTPSASVTEEVSEEPAGELYAVKIDGEEQQVTLDELQAGYQRQGDYTRKTQELADERRRLAQAESIVTALENDPEATIGALARTFDVGLDNRSVSSSNDDFDMMDEDVDPNSKRIAELEARLEQQDRFQRQQQIEKTVENLQDKYGDFDSTELLQHAVKNGIDNLEAALTHMRYSAVEQERSKLKSELDVYEKKREASTVEAGGSKQPSAVPDSKEVPSSIREAFAQALKQHAE